MCRQTADFSGETAADWWGGVGAPPGVYLCRCVITNGEETLTWWPAACCAGPAAAPGRSACTGTPPPLWPETPSHTRNRSPAPGGWPHLQEGAESALRGGAELEHFTPDLSEKQTLAC